MTYVSSNQSVVFTGSGPESYSLSPHGPMCVKHVCYWPGETATLTMHYIELYDGGTTSDSAVVSGGEKKCTLFAGRTQNDDSNDRANMVEPIVLNLPGFGIRFEDKCVVNIPSGVEINGVIVFQS